MLKRILSVAAAALIFVPAALAQENKGAKVTVEETNDENGRVVITRTESEGQVKTNSFNSNWSIGFEAGVGYYLGDNDNLASFGQRTAPAFNLYVTKFATPVFGLGLTLGAGQMKGGAFASEEGIMNAHYMTDKHLAADNAYLQSGWYFNPHIDALLDLDNLIAGYNPFRVYNVELSAGGGVMLGFDKKFGENTCYVAPAFNLGLLNSFNLNDRFAIVVNLRGLITGNNFDGEIQGVAVDGLMSLTAGLNIKLGDLPKRSFQTVSDVKVDRYSTKVYNAGKVQLEEAKHQLSIIEAENDILSTAAAAAANSCIPLSILINFEKGSSAVSNAAMIDLMAAAQAIKSTPGTRYGISGSKARAQAIFDILTGELGVDAGQLEIQKTGANLGGAIISTIVK